MKNKKPIAMICNREQFEAIKPKLEKSGKSINSISINEFDKYPYLVNCYQENTISNFRKDYFRHVWRNVETTYEQWNEKVFLEACGIETTPTLEEIKEYFKDADKCISTQGTEFEYKKDYNIGHSEYLSMANDNGIYCNKGSYQLWHPQKGYAKIITKKSPEYTITREQVLTIHEKTSVSNQEELEEWFPQAFEEEKAELPNDFSGWCKCNGRGNEKWMGKFEKGIFQYGIGADGKWFENKTIFHNFKISSSNIEATPKEVEKALKNEAVRRGFVEGVYFQVPNSLTISKCENEIILNPKNNSILYYGDYCIFKDGKWASIIPTKTKEEAEKLLNCRIV